MSAYAPMPRLVAMFIARIAGLTSFCIVELVANKPALMSEVAAQADIPIVTSDNPRSEDPASIRAEVMAGTREAIDVADRAEAILRGVDALQAGDALLICGKGHETGQIVGDDVFPFDDVEQASMAVAALDGVL